MASIYVMVVILFMDNSFKVASDQILYDSMDMCEVSKAEHLKLLELSKPTPDSFATAKCVEMTIVEKKTST